MKRIEYLDNKMKITDTETGQIKYMPLASDRQMAFLRNLEAQAKVEPKKYEHLTVWQASKVIDKLKKKISQTELLDK